MARGLVGFVGGPPRPGRQPGWFATPDQAATLEVARLRRRVVELEAQLGDIGIEHTEPTAERQASDAELAGYAGDRILDNADILVSADA